MARLIVKFRGAVVQERVMDKPSIRIGRGEGNNIKMLNLAVSGNHAKVERVNGSYIIVDLKSTNLTFVNNKKIPQAKLYHLDEITIGKHRLVFEDQTQTPRPMDAGSEAQPLEAQPEPAASRPIQEVPGRPATLQFLLPGDQPEVVLEEELVIIGRMDDADVRLRGVFDPKVAALITRKPTAYSIPPEGKTRVRINGEPITQRTDLKDGDVREVESLKLLFSQR